MKGKSTDNMLQLSESGRRPNPSWCAWRRAYVGVTSALGNFDQRQSIRDTWGSDFSESGHTLRFFVGSSPDEPIISKVREENLVHHDVVILNSSDSYYSLTNKTIGIIREAVSEEGSYSHLIKADDDTYVRVENLEKHIGNVCVFRGGDIVVRAIPPPEPIYVNHFLFGHIERKTKPERGIKHKYYVSKYKYPFVYYPAYAQGFMYIMDFELARDLARRELQSSFTMEDVSLGGWIQSHKLDVAFINDPAMSHHRGCADSHVGSHRMSPTDMHCVHHNSTKGCECMTADHVLPTDNSSIDL